MISIEKINEWFLFLSFSRTLSLLLELMVFCRWTNERVKDSDNHRRFSRKSMFSTRREEEEVSATTKDNGELCNLKLCLPQKRFRKKSRRFHCTTQTGISRREHRSSCMNFSFQIVHFILNYANKAMMIVGERRRELIPFQWLNQVKITFWASAWRSSDSFLPASCAERLCYDGSRYWASADAQSSGTILLWSFRVTCASKSERNCHHR